MTYVLSVVVMDRYAVKEILSHDTDFDPCERHHEGG